MPWSDSNADYFTRNIVTYMPPYWLTSAVSTSTVDELLAHIATSNATKFTWPTAGEVGAIIEASGHPEITGADPARPLALEMATAAAVTRIGKLKGIPVRPVDADGAVDEAGDPVEIDADVWLATVLLAARLYDRRDDPDRTPTPGAMGLDPDIEFLLEEPPSL